MRQVVARGVHHWLLAVHLLLAGLPLASAPADAQTLPLLNVPYLTQSEALCGGAAAAMVMRYWGAPDVTAESFSGLIDRRAAGIPTDRLQSDLVARGWNAVTHERDETAIEAALKASRPAIALIEDRPGVYHYVVVVGWYERAVALHDPARTPFRIMPLQEFLRRWRAARQWTLIATPAAAVESASLSLRSSVETVAPGSANLSCESSVASGVESAQAGRLDAAERILAGTIASCPGTAGLRELAGVRALQRRWPEVIELASAVVEETPGDTYSWQLLATARFVSDDPQGALAAWNEAGQPRLDLVQTEGLQRTPQRILEELIPAQRGSVLTSGLLRHVDRQLADWPAMTRTAVRYVPKEGGQADLRVAVTERDLFPRGRVALGIIAGRALITRELRVAFGPMTSGGDRLEVGWRFWPDRPRYAATLQAPAPWGGIWGIQASAERQPLTAPALATFRHDSVGLIQSRWQTNWLRWQVGGGLDRWAASGRHGTVSGAVDLVTPRDGVRLRVRGQSWFGTEGFSSLDVSLRTSRALRGRRYVVDGRALLSRVSESAPYDIWPAGDTGHARATLLRAHPLVTGGRYRTARLGSDVATASLEGVRLWTRRGAQFGPALFADIGRTGRRVSGASVRDVDVGVGLRLRVPGASGTIRVDFAKGLRDGARALSFVYEP